MLSKQNRSLLLGFGIQVGLVLGGLLFGGSLPAHAGECGSGGSTCNSSPTVTNNSPSVTENSTNIPVTSTGTNSGNFTNSNLQSGTQAYYQIINGQGPANARAQFYHNGGRSQLVIECGQSQFQVGAYPSINNDRFSLTGQVGYISNNAPFNCGELVQLNECYQAWDLNSSLLANGVPIAESELSKRCSTKYGFNIRIGRAPTAPTPTAPTTTVPVAPTTIPVAPVKPNPVTPTQQPTNPVTPAKF